MMQFSYCAQFEADPDGGFIVTFPDIAEAITHGHDKPSALANARDALGMALLGYADAGRELPPANDHPGLTRVVPLAAQAAKLGLIASFKAEGISKSELGRRLHKTEGEARRLLDPDYPSKIADIDAALAALDRQMVVGVEAA